jgi:hypothetical protein
MFQRQPDSSNNGIVTSSGQKPEFASSAASSSQQQQQQPASSRASSTPADKVQGWSGNAGAVDSSTSAGGGGGGVFEGAGSQMQQGWQGLTKGLSHAFQSTRNGITGFAASLGQQASSGAAADLDGMQQGQQAGKQGPGQEGAANKEDGSEKRGSGRR